MLTGNSLWHIRVYMSAHICVSLSTMRVVSCVASVVRGAHCGSCQHRIHGTHIARTHLLSFCRARVTEIIKCVVSARLLARSCEHVCQVQGIRVRSTVANVKNAELAQTTSHICLRENSTTVRDLCHPQLRSVSDISGKPREIGVCMRFGVCLYSFYLVMFNLFFGVIFHYVCEYPPL